MNKKKTITAKVITASSKATSLMGRIKPATPAPQDPGFKMTDHDYRIQ